jgi:HEAT repeat protein
VLNSLTSEKHIEMLFDVISNSKLDREQDSFRLMMLLSVNPVIRKEMLKRFSHIHLKSLKERIMEGLATSGNELCAEISDVLKTEESITTQRDLINLLAMIGSDEAYEIIADNVETTSIDLKMIILEALSKKQTEYAVTAYLKTLTDSNENVRLKTLEYLTLYNDLKILNKVNDAVSEQSFHERSLDEKRQCMMIIANNSSDLKNSYLYEIVEHSSLLKNRKFVETQAAAAMTLGILGDAKHKPFLQRHYKRLMAPKALKEACKFSLEMLSK